MEERTLIVNYNNITSSIRYVKLGVPQGSVLGSLLFMLYLNDLPNYVDRHVTMYADDTTISISAGNGQVKLRAEHIMNQCLV